MRVSGHAVLKNCLAPLIKAHANPDEARFTAFDIGPLTQFFADHLLAQFRLFSYVLLVDQEMINTDVEKVVEVPWIPAFHGVVQTGTSAIMITLNSHGRTHPVATHRHRYSAFAKLRGADMKSCVHVLIVNHEMCSEQEWNDALEQQAAEEEEARKLQEQRAQEEAEAAEAARLEKEKLDVCHFLQSHCLSAVGMSSIGHPNWFAGGI